jgi:hypothetical protein
MIVAARKEDDPSMLSEAAAEVLFGTNLGIAAIPEDSALHHAPEVTDYSTMALQALRPQPQVVEEEEEEEESLWMATMTSDQLALEETDKARTKKTLANSAFNPFSVVKRMSSRRSIGSSARHNQVLAPPEDDELQEEMMYTPEGYIEFNRPGILPVVFVLTLWMIASSAVLFLFVYIYAYHEIAKLQTLGTQVAVSQAWVHAVEVVAPAVAAAKAVDAAFYGGSVGHLSDYVGLATLLEPHLDAVRSSGEPAVEVELAGLPQYMPRLRGGQSRVGSWLRARNAGRRRRLRVAHGPCGLRSCSWLPRLYSGALRREELHLVRHGSGRPREQGRLVWTGLPQQRTA